MIPRHLHAATQTRPLLSCDPSKKKGQVIRGAQEEATAITRADPLHIADVFSQHRTQLRRAARSIVGDAHSADDLVHDAYLKAVEAVALNSVELQQPLSYAHRLVRNLAIDHHRRGVLECRIFEAADAGEQVSGPKSCTPEAVTSNRQQLALVQRALSALPERVRRVFEMYRLEGCTQREIGTQLGISAATVNALVQEALERCRAALHGATKAVGGQGARS